MEELTHRVMVVDDEPQVAKSLHRLLRRHYQVMTAQNGEEALASLELFEPDVIISDFRMSGMNGAQLLARVKERRPRIGQLIISGYSEIESELLSREDENRPRFLSKPWDCKELLETVRGLIDHQARQ
jgi:two-component system, OmpR family, response regulator VicR